jgi:hypothetical protein
MFFLNLLYYIVYNKGGFPMLKNNKKIGFVILCLSVLMIETYIGCNQDSSVTSTNEPQKRFQNLSVGFFSESNVQDNVLIITEAKFVLRQMNLKVYNSETLNNIRMDPFVVHLDVNGRVILAAIANLPTGNYERIKFQLHKPTGNENVNDADFTEGNRNYSTVVKGYYNGNPFVFKSAITAARGIDIENSPLFISVGGGINLTIPINPYLWFDHNGLMNPMDENNRHNIDKNIQDCFKRIFKDMDMNGEPD